MEELKRFETALLNQNLACSTINSYLEDVIKFLEWSTNEVKAENGCSNNNFFESYIKYLINKKLSISTINRRIVSIGKYCSFIKSIESSIPLFPSAQVGNDYLSSKEIMRLKNEVYKIKDKTIISFLIYAGLTAKEICNLLLRDIDLSADKIYIENRIVPLHKKLKSIIIEYLSSRYYKKNNENLLFYYRSKMSPSGIHRIVGSYSIKPTQLRNTFFHYLEDNNCDFFIFYYLLGKKIETFNETINFDKVKKIVEDIQY
ncbi:MAG: tyrosine-type recombinase/integrase [Clostridia bacterium]